MSGPAGRPVARAAAGGCRAAGWGPIRENASRLGAHLNLCPTGAGPASSGGPAAPRKGTIQHFFAPLFKPPPKRAGGGGAGHGGAARGREQGPFRANADPQPLTRPPWPPLCPAGAAPAPPGAAAPHETQRYDFTRLGKEEKGKSKTYNFSQLFNVVDPSPWPALREHAGWAGDNKRGKKGKNGKRARRASQNVSRPEGEGRGLLGRGSLARGSLGQGSMARGPMPLARRCRITRGQAPACERPPTTWRGPREPRRPRTSLGWGGQT